MSAIAEHETDMARKPKRDDEMTRFDRQLLKKARVVANLRDLVLAEYISDAARHVIERDFAKAIREQSRHLDEPR
jgi:predicted RNA binding protein with dsRBD fold (UPF0201 family)